MAGWMDLEISFWLLVAIGLGLVLLVGRKTQSPSSDASSSASGVATAGSKRKQGLGSETPASKAARDAAKHLGLGTGARGRRVPVTVCVADVVLSKDERGQWSANEPALRALALLNEVASVFLVCWVESDEEERRVKEVALSCNLTTGSSAPSAPLAVTTPTGIPEHRLLFCSSHIGQVAIVRQLTPSMHIGGPVALLEGIYRFVPSLVRIDPSAVEPPPTTAPPPQPPAGQGARKATGGGGLEWREFRSLSAALGLPAHAPDPSSLSPRGVEGESGGGGAAKVANAPAVESSYATPAAAAAAAASASASAALAGQTTGARRRVLKHQDGEDQEGEAFSPSKFCTSAHS